MKTIRAGIVFLAFLFSAMAHGEDSDIPMGMLGLPFGTFAVIVGTCVAPTPPKKAKSFRVQAVNGTVLEKPIVINLSADPNKMKDGASYVLHGLETGIWVGSPAVPAGESASIYEGWQKEPPFGPFSLNDYFHVTSIERENGALVPDARPLSPGFKLADPHFPVPLMTTPVGVLGKPLGTYVKIKIGAPRGPVDGIVCEVLEVNGKPVTHRTTIAIPFLQVPSGKDTEVVHGFESGDWRDGLTPDSEWKVQSPGIFGGSGLGGGPPRKISFCRYFIMTNWDKRIPQNPGRP